MLLAFLTALCVNVPAVEAVHEGALEQDGVVCVLKPLTAAVADSASHHYYEGEQESAVAVVVASGISVVAGSALLFVDDDLARGLGSSLAVVGVFGAAGFGFYLAVIPAMVSDLEQRLAADPATLVHTESLRLDGVIDRFVWLRLIEGGVATAGLVAAGVGAGSDNAVVTGVGLGVASGALGLFMYDSLAADRARLYRQTFE